MSDRRQELHTLPEYLGSQPVYWCVRVAHLFGILCCVVLCVCFCLNAVSCMLQYLCFCLNAVSCMLQYLWFVHSWSSIPFSLMFICKRGGLKFYSDIFINECFLMIVNNLDHNKISKHVSIMIAKHNNLWWLSHGTLDPYINKTDRCDTADILLKVA